MRVVAQRVTQASVTVEAKVIGQIGTGLLILVCAMQGDTEAGAATMAAKIARLRIFRDEQGRMNHSLADVGGAALVVSQFTLAADTSRGNRPGFTAAARPHDAERLYLHFVDSLRGLGFAVATGKFGADMAVTLTNDGPVTLWLET